MKRFLCKTGYVDELGDELGYLVNVQKLIHGNKWVTMTKFQCVIKELYSDVLVSEDLETRSGVTIGNKLFDLQSLMSDEDMNNFKLQLGLDDKAFTPYNTGYFLESTGLVVLSTEDEFKDFIKQVP